MQQVKPVIVRAKEGDPVGTLVTRRRDAIDDDRVIDGVWLLASRTSSEEVQVLYLQMTDAEVLRFKLALNEITEVP